jgi:2-C-methyl-D-erythritol 4-phosphate cytidylyltransferase
VNLQKYAIIVGGGSGARMGSELPKQFLTIGTKPILVHTIERFLSLEAMQIILVLPIMYFSNWDKLQQEYFSENKNIKLVKGGSTRFQSVKNGLLAIKATKGLVAVHDAVRPFVEISKIKESFVTAHSLGSAVLAVKSKDSLRKIGPLGSKVLDRENVVLIQTPQTFDLEKLLTAYKVEESTLFTDDASVFEASGFLVNLIEGSYSNIKITTPEDLDFAHVILSKSLKV